MKRNVLIAVLLLSCTPASAPTAIDACDTMCRIGCSAGCLPWCAETIDQLARDRVLVVNVACIAQAETIEAVNACGDIGCTQ